MQLVNNINVLNEYFPGLWPVVKNIEQQLTNDENINIINTRSGLPTLMVRESEREMYVHSKYDPQIEAERFVSQFAEEAEKYDHVFFYGLGLGYHIEQFAKRFPLKAFSIYEPHPTVFYKYLTVNSLSHLPLNKLKNIYIEFKGKNVQEYANSFLSSIKGEVLFVVLPCYERIFAQAYQRFTRYFLQAVKDKRSSLNTNLGYQKRWILNSLINFNEVLTSPNILHDLDLTKFNQKPAILVAAGPSLDEEIENLRHIKENGLAYIFSVGSALNTLIECGVYPDAACSYDPSVRNQIVFDKIASMDLKDIPLVFGSSIGFEALQKYPGDKLHMITSQDTVASFLLGKEIKKIADAPSIAVLTLNLLLEMGFNPVVLVGQNLALRKDKFYAEGISYAQKQIEITDSNKDSYIEVEDVYGNLTYTVEGFNKARLQMERYIQFYSLIKGHHIVNSTKGGAKIAGAEFIPFENVIRELFKVEEIVDPDWFRVDSVNSYDKSNILDKIILLDVRYKELLKINDNIYQALKKIYEMAENIQLMQLEKEFKRLDKIFNRLQKNDFYTVFLSPMNRVQYEMLGRNVSSVRFERDLTKKAPVIINEFGKFLEVCKQDIQMIYPVFNMVKGLVEAAVANVNIPQDAPGSDLI